MDEERSKELFQELSDHPLARKIGVEAAAKVLLARRHGVLPCTVETTKRKETEE